MRVVVEEMQVRAYGSDCCRYKVLSLCVYSCSRDKEVSLYACDFSRSMVVTPRVYDCSRDTEFFCS